MSEQTKIGSLRIWWVPQVPMKAFYAPVESLREAKLLLETLARYDLFQLENRIKPDFCNAGGLQVFEADAGDGEAGWSDWYNEDGYGIDEVDENGFLA